VSLRPARWVGSARRPKRITGLPTTLAGHSLSAARQRPPVSEVSVRTTGMPRWRWSSSGAVDRRVAGRRGRTRVALEPWWRPRPKVDPGASAIADMPAPSCPVLEVMRSPRVRLACLSLTQTGHDKHAEQLHIVWTISNASPPACGSFCLAFVNRTGFPLER
jgi:hypothetical protein